MEFFNLKILKNDAKYCVLFTLSDWGALLNKFVKVLQIFLQNRFRYKSLCDDDDLFLDFCEFRIIASTTYKPDNLYSAGHYKLKIK